jgi:Helix-turn-helix domain
MSTKISISNTEYGLDEMVSHDIAAKITGYAPRTIRNLATARKIPFYRISNRYNRYLVRELLEWRNKRKVQIKEQ